jgi:hypothetical protein
MNDPAFPKFPSEELAAANQAIADCIALSQRALGEATRIAEQYKIVIEYRLNTNAFPDTIYYNPTRNWVNSDHQCKAEDYRGNDGYGEWSIDKPVPLVEVDEHEYRYY